MSSAEMSKKLGPYQAQGQTIKEYKIWGGGGEGGEGRGQEHKT